VRLPNEPDRIETAAARLSYILQLRHRYKLHKHSLGQMGHVFGDPAEERLEALDRFVHSLNLTSPVSTDQILCKLKLKQLPAQRVALLELFDTYPFCEELAAHVLAMRAGPDRPKIAEFKKIEEIEAEFDKPLLKDEHGQESLTHRLAALFFLREDLAQDVASVLQLPVPFQMVLRREIECVSSARLLRNGDERDISGDNCWEKARQANLFGVAFSGGGIRSATFNLGILQGLAEVRMLAGDPSRRLLHLVDYLSTVSGGGYIGSWLHAWILRSDEKESADSACENCHQTGLDQVISNLSPETCPDPEADPQAPIKFLRRYSRYLTPETGFFSADTWTVVAIWLRNTVLNLAVLALGLAGVLLIPRAFHDPKSFVSQWWTALAALPLVAWALLVAGVNLSSFSDPGRRQDRIWYQQKGVQLFVVVPLLLASVILSGWYQWLAAYHPPHFSLYANANFLFGVTSAVLLLMVSAVGRYYDSWYDDYGDRNPGDGQRTRRKVDMCLGLFLCTAFTGAAAGGLSYLLATIFWAWPGWVKTKSFEWSVLTFGPPLLMVLLSAILVIHIGLLGRNLPDDRREWWSRAGAYILLYAGGWLALSGIAFWAPTLFHWIPEQSYKRWVTGSVAAWLLATVSGVISGKSKSTGADTSGKTNAFLQLVATVAPYIFIFGLLALLSWGIDGLVGHFSQEPSLPLHVLPSWQAPLFAAACIGVAFILAWRVNVNEFSMYHYYRSRLVRCYLGASEGIRRPNRFTGLDPDDDRPLGDFTPKSDAPLKGLPRGGPARVRYSGPYPIVNTTLNIVQGDELAWQDRKAQSFMFTPEFCGYATTPTKEIATEHDGDARLASFGFRPTRRFAYPELGIPLGSAMAISGAAASPNEGYNTSAATAFLMTVFNVRLGWWISNTRDRRTWQRATPAWGLFYLLRELFAATNNKSAYLYLSDGGHFENLGLYELIHRRCRFIIASDASQDGGLKFEDLGRAVRQCRADFGAEINIGVESLRKDSGGSTPGQCENADGTSKAHCVVARIKYSDSSVGTLLYIKPTITGDEPADVGEYRTAHPEFPHETTLDQFFTESQFESYRKLGYHAIRKIFDDNRFTGKKEDPGAAVAGPAPPESRDGVALANDLHDLFEDLYRRWYPSSAANDKSFTRLTVKFDELNERLRNHKELAALDCEFYPEVSQLPPAPLSSFRDVFYYCTSLIQLMENVYTDLRLEDNDAHPDNQGWMNTFARWSRSASFKKTWLINNGLFGARFRAFATKRFNLKPGDIGIGPTTRRPDFTPPPNTSVYGISITSGDFSFEVGFLLLIEETKKGKTEKIVVWITIDEPYRRLGLAVRAIRAAEKDHGYAIDLKKPSDEGFEALAAHSDPMAARALRMKVQSAGRPAGKSPGDKEPSK